MNKSLWGVNCFRFLNLYGGRIKFWPGDDGLGKYIARGPSLRNRQRVSFFPPKLVSIFLGGRILPVPFLRHKLSLSPTGLWVKVQYFAVQSSWTCSSKPILCWSALSCFSLDDEYFQLNGVSRKGLKKIGGYKSQLFSQILILPPKIGFKYCAGTAE